jgi:hypothetical protein
MRAPGAGTRFTQTRTFMPSLHANTGLNPRKADSWSHVCTPVGFARIGTHPNREPAGLNQRKAVWYSNVRT